MNKTKNEELLNLQVEVVKLTEKVGKLILELKEILKMKGEKNGIKKV